MHYLENALAYEDYCALRKSVGWCGFPREQTVAALSRTLWSVVAVDAGQPVAMGRLVGDGLYDTIVDVVVRPEYQGRGIGREILRRILQRVAEHTPEGGRTSVQLIAEPGKESFYESLGFRRIPHAHCGSGMRLVVHS